MKYKIHQGSLAFMLHRLTGVMLIGYLMIHIFALTGLHDPVVWHEKMELFTSPLFTALEYMLFLPILFHSINGVRLIVVEWTNSGSRNQKKMLAATYAVSVLLAGAMLFVFLGHEAYDTKGVEKYNEKFQKEVKAESCSTEKASECSTSTNAWESKDTPVVPNASDAIKEACKECTDDKKCEKCETSGEDK